MAIKTVMGVAVRTDRDDARAARLQMLHEEWALLDAKMDAVDAAMGDNHAE